MPVIGAGSCSPWEWRLQLFLFSGRLGLKPARTTLEHVSAFFPTNTAGQQPLLSDVGTAGARFSFYQMWFEPSLRTLVDSVELIGNVFCEQDQITLYCTFTHLCVSYHSFLTLVHSFSQAHI